MSKSKKAPGYTTGISIGHESSNKTIKATAKAIVEVVDATAALDNATVVVALQVLRSAASIEGTTISGCDISMGS